MTKKKTKKSQKNASKMLNDINVSNIDINDIDAIMEDMKKLAFEDKMKEDVVSETSNIEKKEEIIDETVEVKDNINNEEIITNFGFEEFEDNIPVAESDLGLINEFESTNSTETVLNEEEEKKQNLEKNEKQASDNNKPKVIKNASQTGIYDTWMGYGYTSYV